MGAVEVRLMNRSKGSSNSGAADEGVCCPRS